MPAFALFELLPEFPSAAKCIRKAAIRITFQRCVLSAAAFAKQRSEEDAHAVLRKVASRCATLVPAVLQIPLMMRAATMLSSPVELVVPVF